MQPDSFHLFALMKISIGKCYLTSPIVFTPIRHTNGTIESGFWQIFKLNNSLPVQSHGEQVQMSYRN